MKAQKIVIALLVSLVVIAMAYLVSIVPSESETYTFEFISTKPIFAFIVMFGAAGAALNISNKELN